MFQTGMFFQWEKTNKQTKQPASGVALILVWPESAVVGSCQSIFYRHIAIKYNPTYIVAEAGEERNKNKQKTLAESWPLLSEKN
jgi:hypothetical protein